MKTTEEYGELISVWPPFIPPGGEAFSNVQCVTNKNTVTLLVAALRNLISFAIPRGVLQFVIAIVGECSTYGPHLYSTVLQTNFLM
jgi:hypothetical protein